MDYSKIYNNLMSSRKSLNRKKVKGQSYYENHHINPRCFGGPNTKENLVLLTFREHWIAHKLLVEMYQGEKKRSMVHAWWRMCQRTKYSKNKNVIVSNREYQEARRIFCIEISGENHYDISGEKNPNFGKVYTEDEKINLAQISYLRNKGKGRKQSKEIREKISLSKLGKKTTGWGNRPVKQFDLNGNFIKEYDNHRIAAKENNLSRNKIIACCKKERFSHGNFRWCYSNEELN